MRKFFKNIGYKGPFIDFSKYLRKGSPATAPNKVVVMFCWVLVIIALIFAFFKIVFRV